MKWESFDWWNDEVSRIKNNNDQERQLPDKVSMRRSNDQMTRSGKARWCIDEMRQWPCRSDNVQKRQWPKKAITRSGKTICANNQTRHFQRSSQVKSTLSMKRQFPQVTWDIPFFLPLFGIMNEYDPMSIWPLFIALIFFKETQHLGNGPGEMTFTVWDTSLFCRIVSTWTVRYIWLIWLAPHRNQYNHKNLTAGQKGTPSHHA